MPERWQREFRKLREVNVPPSVLERARSGPRRELPPPPRQRVIAVVVAFAVFIAGGALAWNALRPRSSGPAPVGDVEPRPIVVARFSETGPEDDVPYGTLAIGLATQEGQIGSYSWTGGNSASSVEVVGVHLEHFLQVPPGSELRIKGTATSVTGWLGTTKFPFERIAELDFADGPAILEAEPGRYSLELDAHWPQGDVPFYFGIEIPSPAGEPSPTASDDTNAPDVARIVCGVDGTTKVITPTVRVQPDGVHFAVDNEGGVDGLTIASSALGGAITPREWDAPGSTSFVLDVPVGDAVVLCGWAKTPRLTGSEPGTAQVSFVDPEGLWTSWIPDCKVEDMSATWGQGPGFGAYGSANPVHSDLTSVLPRAIPGILPTDVVGPAGYPRDAGITQDWRVVQNGEVVGSVGVPRRAVAGVFYFGPVIACTDSLIGEEGQSTAGLLGTPFEVPGYLRCDPYMQECVLVYLSEDRFGSLSRGFPVGVWSGSDCGQDLLPVGCGDQPEGTSWYALRMTPADAEAFIQANGCGATLDEMCR